MLARLVAGIILAGFLNISVAAQDVSSKNNDNPGSPAASGQPASLQQTDRH